MTAFKQCKTGFSEETMKGTILALTVLAGLAAAPVHAQPQQHAGQAPMAPGSQGPMGGMPAMQAPPMQRMMMHHGQGRPGTMGQRAMPRDPTHRLEGRLAFMRAELAITETQSSAWEGFAAAVRTSARRLAELLPRRDASAPTPTPAPLPERLERAEQMLSARLEGLKAVRGSFTALYAQLSDQQKKTAEELVPMGLFQGPMMRRG
jgi:hypothetical protein